MNVEVSWPIVFHLMLLNRDLSSRKYSSEPAANAIKARAISLIKFSREIDVSGIRPKKYGPHIIPEIKKPVMKGSLICLNEIAILFEAIVMTTKPKARIKISFPPNKNKSIY